MIVTPEQVAKAEKAGLRGMDLTTSLRTLEARTAGMTYPQFLEPIAGSTEEQVAYLTKMVGGDAVRLAMVLAHR